MKNSNKAFTLIELLVVVLIIGILAAVAVPQYQVAVTKARIATILPILKAMADAQESYYLSNGSYTTNGTLLDIQMPSECSVVEGTHYKHYFCKDFMTDFSTEGSVNASYCPKADSQSCAAKRDFLIAFRLSHHISAPNKRICVVYNNSPLGTKICNTLFQ